MPIIRTYACPECNHRIEVTLAGEQWDDPPPQCPRCVAWEMRQEFKPVALGGSNKSKATALAENILAEDYNVADMKHEHRPQGTPSVRYKEPPPNAASDSKWGVAQEALSQAISYGRQSRLKYGSGLDVLQHNLKTGAEPDLIEASKRRSPRIY